MPNFGNSDYPIQDPAVQEKIDQDILTPLQSASGGVWGLGIWRRYNIASLLWGSSTVGSSLNIPKNAGHLSVVRIGDNTMLFTLDMVNGIAVAGADTSFINFDLPDGIQYACRQPIDTVLNARGGVMPCLVNDVTGGSVGPGYVVPAALGSPSTMTVAQTAGNFLNGRTYCIWAQWALEVAVVKARA